jgi:hypothetical protein
MESSPIDKILNSTGGSTNKTAAERLFKEEEEDKFERGLGDSHQKNILLLSKQGTSSTGAMQQVTFNFKRPQVRIKHYYSLRM